MSDWSSADDFGQKIDLTVRIREILRNYPEGLSILKELLQNADDAGARTVRFCVAEARVAAPASPNDALTGATKGPSLLAYNDAKFSKTDFKSIQQIGNSLKKAGSGNKTGRFGVGVNSVYHLTEGARAAATVLLPLCCCRLTKPFFSFSATQIRIRCH